MIVFEDGIEAIINQMPEMGGFAINFHWGDQDELNRYIALKGQPYPIVWLVSGNETHDDRNEEVTRDCRFIIAVREIQTDKLNDYRLKNSFTNWLNPLTERLIEGLKKSKLTDIPERNYKIEKHPNYSDSGKNKTIDLWDAITIDCKVTMINNCQNTIKWQTN